MRLSKLFRQFAVSGSKGQILDGRKINPLRANGFSGTETSASEKSQMNPVMSHRVIQFGEFFSFVQ